MRATLQFRTQDPSAIRHTSSRRPYAASAGSTAEWAHHCCQHKPARVSSHTRRAGAGGSGADEDMTAVVRQAERIIYEVPRRQPISQSPVALWARAVVPRNLETSAEGPAVKRGRAANGPC